MSDNEVVVREDMPPIGDDFLIQVADQAEKRIDAVIKIKRVALKVTNARDWTDQNGNPYLQVSGSEKIANLFSISWRIEEPKYDEEPDGHFTYSIKGEFSLGGRTIEVEGTRSSKDPFFNRYDYTKPKDSSGKHPNLPPSSIDKGDVKKAALTNLYGNGITRILGIRNLTWDDLAEFAGITKETVTSIQYKKGPEKPPISAPQSKSKPDPDDAFKGSPSPTDDAPLISEKQAGRFYAIAKGAKWEDEALHKWLMDNYGLDSSKKITKAQYENICQIVAQGPDNA